MSLNVRKAFVDLDPYFEDFTRKMDWRAWGLVSTIVANSSTPLTDMGARDLIRAVMAREGGLSLLQVVPRLTPKAANVALRVFGIQKN